MGFAPLLVVDCVQCTATRGWQVGLAADRDGIALLAIKLLIQTLGHGNGLGLKRFLVAQTNLDTWVRIQSIVTQNGGLFSCRAGYWRFDTATGKTRFWQMTGVTAASKSVLPKQNGKWLTDLLLRKAALVRSQVAAGLKDLRLPARAPFS